MSVTDGQSNLPDWWSWELELSTHVIKRMKDRSFTETDLRAMIEDVYELVPDVTPGRWLVRAALGGQEWAVIIEPDDGEQVVVVVTAYPVE